MGDLKFNLQKAIKINEALNEYFQNTDIDRIQAKELMDFFIEKEIFNKNYRDGLPIRKLLRQLEKDNLLNLIPQAYFEQKDVNKNWYFLKPNKLEETSFDVQS